MSLLIAAIVNICYVFCVVNCGLIIFSLINKKSNYDFDIYSLMSSSFVLGLGFISNLWLFLGLLSIFKKIIIIIVLFLFTLSSIFFRRQYINFFKSIGKNIKRIKNYKWSIKSLIIFFLILIFFISIIYGISSLIMPPTGDAEAFYMVWPKIIAASERILPQPNYFDFSQIGFSGELHFAALISISNTNAATFFVFFIAVLIALILIQISSQLKTGILSKILVFIMLITTTTFTSYISGGNVNLFATLFGLAAFYWAIKFIDSGNKRILAFIAIFMGFSVIAKFSYLPIILSGVFLIIVLKYIYPDEKKLKHSKILDLTYSLFIVVVIFLIVLIPHLIKNYVLFKEPFAPFYLLKDSTSFGWTDQVWYSPEKTKHILLTYPIALTIGQYPMQGGNITPFIIMFLPLAFLLNKKEKFFSRDYLYLHIGIIAIISIILWMVVRPSVLAPRYILVTLLIFIPVTAKLVETIWVQNKNKLVLKIVIIFSIITIFALIGKGEIFEKSKTTFHVLKENKNGRTGYESVWYGSCSFMNEYLKSTERIYFAGWYTYFLRPDLLQCIQNPKDGDLITENKIFDKDRLIMQGFNYVLIQKDTFGYLNQDITVKYFKNIYEDEYSVVYKIINFDKKLQKFIPKQINPPAWDIIKIQ